MKKMQKKTKKKCKMRTKRMRMMEHGSSPLGLQRVMVVRHSPARTGQWRKRVGLNVNGMLKMKMMKMMLKKLTIMMMEDGVKSEGRYHIVVVLICSCH